MSTHAKPLKLHRIFWFMIILDVLIADQISKWFITEKVMRPAIEGKDGLDIFQWYMQTPSMLEFTRIKVTSFFNLVMAWNSGVSFSMFSSAGAYMPYILVTVACLIIGLFTTWLLRSNDKIHSLCYALIIGGALGNVIDRIRFGAVIDFLDVHAYGYHWPAFNIADMSVVTGIVLLMIFTFIFDLKDKALYPDASQKE